jgi:hypothetical protein
MGTRGQTYLLLAMSMLFLLYGVVGGLVEVFVLKNGLSGFTVPFTLVGLLGLYLTSVISRLSERIERLERSQADRTGVSSIPVGAGSGDFS